mmetsp:Transcript_63461/g.174736  ORF Transcript_63461/g.174736 Transcript_63461/m.174736 type:complete len:290 (+) Transcript_63461:337-1206(+)
MEEIPSGGDGQQWGQSVHRVHAVQEHQLVSDSLWPDESPAHLVRRRGQREYRHGGGYLHVQGLRVPGTRLDLLPGQVHADVHARLFGDGVNLRGFGGGRVRQGRGFEPLHGRQIDGHQRPVDVQRADERLVLLLVLDLRGAGEEHGRARSPTRREREINKGPGRGLGECGCSGVGWLQCTCSFATARGPLGIFNPLRIVPSLGVAHPTTTLHHPLGGPQSRRVRVSHARNASVTNTQCYIYARKGVERAIARPWGPRNGLFVVFGRMNPKSSASKRQTCASDILPVASL